MPPPYDMIGAAGIQAAIGASDDVYKPGVHGEIIVILARLLIGDDTAISLQTQVEGELR
ncbi:hypothetical protein ACKGJO_02750 [Gracilimonas sp. Q87]|uniref:hypothetical protein n=1 Tax=Gracilimonas sp. Q87 TaxID=3384766 RepID=UPI0039841E20